MSKNLKNFIVLDEIDSTNNYANHLISAGNAQTGTVVLAHYQKEGRGQRNNYWESAPKKNLLTSMIVLPSSLEASKQFYLSKIICLSLVRWLAGKGVQASVKWPNDIYINNKKIAGILIETSIKANYIDSAVIGVGLNLNQTEFSPGLPNPISLKIFTSEDYNVINTASELWSTFLELFNELEAGAFNKIDSAYFSYLFRRNEWAWYREKGELTEGRIIGIGEYGQLLLEVRTGAIKSYLFKEIEFVI